MTSHPTIEYLAKPNQEVHRFGRRVSYNEYSMRSPSFARKKEDPREFRVLFIGDSVINGGSTLDQDELAASQIARSLSREWARPVIVMNVSAGSWGPQNQLAYLNEYGLFDCDAAIVFWSTHDLDDVPTFEPLSPDQNPSSALSEGFVRYLLPLLRPDPESAEPIAGPRSRRAEGAMRGLLGHLADRVPVLVLLHLTHPELSSPPGAEISFLATLAASSGADFGNLGPVFARALAVGEEPYRSGDPIHTTPLGQQLIATRVLEWLRVERLRGRPRDE